MPQEVFSSRYGIETIDINALDLPHHVRKVEISKHNRPPIMLWKGWNWLMRYFRYFQTDSPVNTQPVGL